MNARPIVGFEFEVMFIDSARSLVRLQGSGGLYGDGSLAALNAPHVSPTLLARVENSLLGAVRNELAKNGTLRIWKDNNEPALRIKETCLVSSVLSVRPIRAKA